MIQKVEVCDDEDEYFEGEEEDEDLIVEEQSDITEITEEGMTSDSFWRVVVIKDSGVKKLDPERYLKVTRKLFIVHS